MMLRELWYLFPKLIEEAKNDFKLKRKPRLRQNYTLLAPITLHIKP